MFRIFLLLISFSITGAEKASSVNFETGDPNAGAQKLLYVQHVMGLMETHKLAIGQKLPVRMSVIFLNN